MSVPSLVPSLVPQVAIDTVADLARKSVELEEPQGS